ncbi:Zn-dependent protease [Coprobacillus sp. AM42-12AC]|uniref:zinc metallopeptidase n=1 Tax=Faecalibacillus faecis TaxID=1982628 RepID=UPI000E4F16FE|nr:Zn-dependent protease [Coprobacillus sp. AM42-12AC]
MYYYYDSYYMIGYLLVIVGAIIMALAQMKVSSAYNKYSRIENSRHLTGRDVAYEILNQHGLSDVQIYEVKGHLSDHYNPSNLTLNLSSEIYHGTSIASLAVAAHECGHALQHQEGYKPLTFRNMIVPVCNISQTIGWIAILLGLFIGKSSISWLGVLLMSLMLLFQIVTLPVEFDASSRALSILNDRYLTEDEYSGAKKMLTAAALTYVAAMLSTLLSLLRIVLMVMSRDRD